MKTIVIYHKSDYDGIFCREIARKFMPNAELIGWEYGEPTPEISIEDQLYILDLSVPDLMAHPKLIWIDHHKSAIEKYPNTIRGYRIDGVAACRLAWQWFNSDMERGPTAKEHYINRSVDEPFAVTLAGEYDIWDKRDERAELFQHGLRSQELTSLDWGELLDEKQTIGFATKVQKLLFQGKAVQYAKTKENESIIKNQGFTTQFEGLTFLACNAARYNSLLFTAGIKPEHDALFGFNFDGKHWKISLYHAPGKEHHDLSKIAVKYGGGGHKGACGFMSKTLPFMEPS
jgi:uncharacterized protein